MLGLGLGNFGSNFEDDLNSARMAAKFAKEYYEILEAVERYMASRKSMKVILEEGAFLPTSAHETDGGYDLYSRTEAIIPPRDKMSFDIGVHVQLPEGTIGYISSRSGMNRRGISCEGIVDSGYNGSISVNLINHSNEPYEVHEGDRIAQMVILPILKPGLEVVKEFEETERGNNGFGSSGK